MTSTSWRKLKLAVSTAMTHSFFPLDTRTGGLASLAAPTHVPRLGSPQSPGAPHSQNFYTATQPTCPSQLTYTNVHMWGCVCVAIPPIISLQVSNMLVRLTHFLFAWAWDQPAFPLVIGFLDRSMVTGTQRSQAGGHSARSLALAGSSPEALNHGVCTSSTVFPSF